jgi:hypothetical protein
MTSENASGYSNAVGGPWRPLREFPCWRSLIAVLTATMLLPAAAHAGCEQVTARLAAAVQPQVGPSYVENGYLAIPITPAMVFRGAATISSHPLPVNDIHLQFVQNVTAWSGRAKYAQGATLSRRPGAGAAFPLLDRCSPSNPSCDESTFPFVDNDFRGKVMTGATRVVKESEQPTLKVPLGLCQPQHKLKKIDFTTEFVTYFGCYVSPDQRAFAPVKELRWSARVQGSVTYDLSGRPTFVPGPLSGVRADLATDPIDTPTMSEPVADDAIEFVETCGSSPPPPPPPGDPNYDPQPGEDLSPFMFPAGGPRYSARDFDRYYPVEEKLPGMDYYASELDAGNPSIFSHADAGVIAAGAETAYGRPVGGLRLWVRVTPGESMTGAVIPPAPAYLIRRALKMGHF